MFRAAVLVEFLRSLVTAAKPRIAGLFRALWQAFVYPVTIWLGLVIAALCGLFYWGYDYHRDTVATLAYYDSLDRDKTAELQQLQADTAVWAYQINQLFKKLSDRDKIEYLYSDEVYHLHHAGLQRALDSAFALASQPQSTTGFCAIGSLPGSGDPEQLIDDAYIDPDALPYSAPVDLTQQPDALRSGRAAGAHRPLPGPSTRGGRGRPEGDHRPEGFDHSAAKVIAPGTGQTPQPGRSGGPQQPAETTTAFPRFRSPAAKGQR